MLDPYLYPVDPVVVPRLVQGVLRGDYRWMGSDVVSYRTICLQGAEAGAFKDPPLRTPGVGPDRHGRFHLLRGMV